MPKRNRFGLVPVAAVAASLAATALVPATASADTRAEVRIEGAGRVFETSSAQGIDCSKSWEDPDRSCGFSQWPGFWRVELRAEPAPGWHFHGWDNPGWNLGCSDVTRTCGFMSSPFHAQAMLTARFRGNDSDGDGHPVPHDCNDFAPAIHPGATDILGNGIDENCDGQDAAVKPDGDDDCGDDERDGKDSFETGAGDERTGLMSEWLVPTLRAGLI
jgi:hypothetical protein